MVRSVPLAFTTVLLPVLEDESGEGGYGGVIFAGYGSTTEFKRRTVWHDNEAASGGALYNLGEVMLNSNGFIRGNKAVVRMKPNRQGTPHEHKF